MRRLDHWHRRIAVFARIGMITLIALWIVVSVRTHFSSKPLKAPPTTNESLVQSANDVARTESPSETKSPSEKEATKYITDFLPELQDPLSVIADKSLELKPREMDAYWQLIRFLQNDNQETNSVLRGSSVSVPIERLITNPSRLRGAIVRTELRVRRVLKYSSNDAMGAQSDLFEIWGSQDRTKNWLWVFVTTSLPQGHSQQSLIEKSVEFDGVFFKLQGYHPAKGKSNDPPLVAPMCIGQVGMLQDEKLAAEKKGDITKSNGGIFGMFSMIILCTVLGVAYIFFLRRLSDSKFRAKNRSDSFIELDWLTARGKKTPSLSLVGRQDDNDEST